MTQFLYSSSGDWIAFRRNPKDKYVFDTDEDWIGWLPWGDADVVDTDGDCLGTIVGDRLVVLNRPCRGYPGYPGYPGYAGYQPLPAGARDVKRLK